MKKLIIILFVLIGFIAKAQLPANTFISRNFTGNTKAQWILLDSPLVNFVGTSLFNARYPGTQLVLIGGGDTAFYFGAGGNLWFRSLLSRDTISLSNRINLKLNISDTSSMLSKYLRKVDTTNHWVQDIYARNDSLFKFKNGIESFVDTLNGGGGSGSGTVTSVALSMPSAFSVTGSPITTNGTLAVSGAGTTAQYIRGNGTLAAFDTTAIPTFSAKVRSLFSGGSPITYNQSTGVFGITNANTSGTKGAATFNNSDFTDNGSGLISLRNPSGTPGVDTISRTEGIDSIYFTINGTTYAIKDSTGGGSGNTNSNIGSGYRWAVPNTNNIKTFFTDITASIDSSSNTNGLTLKVDTSVIATQYDLTQVSTTIQTQQSITGDGSSGDKVRLVNDATSPGNDFYYGTNYSGTRGYIPPDVKWYNIVKAGADNTGFTDVSSYIISAIGAGQRYIYLPKGIYLLSNTIQLLDSITIKGDGRNNTVIKFASNITGFTLSNSSGGHFCQFLDFSLSGTFGTTGNTSQIGFSCDSVKGTYFHNIGSYHMGGFTFIFKNNGFLTGNDYLSGNMISDCYTEYSYGGIFFDTRAEYSNVNGCSFTNGTYGVRNIAGNNRITGCNISGNQYNLSLENGSNDGHGEVVGCTINHGAVANVYINGLVNGFDLTANNIYNGRIYVINSDLVNFNAGDISVDSIYVTNSTHTNFLFVKFISEPGWGVTGNSPGVVKYGEASTQGFIIRDPDNNSNFNIINNNSLVTMGSATTDRVQFLNSIVGMSGMTDNSRDLCVGKSRFDLGNTTGDGVQIYKTGGTDASLAVLSSSAAYQIYCKTNGNTGFGGNSNPTAKIHIDAGTSSAGTAPLKFTSGTNLSSIEDGAMEYNGSHLYISIGSTRYQLDQQGGGITTLNTLTAATQTFATGTSGSDFNISSSTSTHTFNIPSASTSNRGLVTTTSQTFGGKKTFNDGAIVTFPSAGSGTSLVVSGDRSLATAPGIAGVGLQLAAFTYTNTEASTTEAGGQNFHLVDVPTLTSSNAVTYSGDVSTIRFVGAPIAGGSSTISHPWNVFANDVNYFQTLSMGLNEQSGDATLGNGSIVVYTGSGGNTFTLPALATHPGKTYFIKNGGSGNLSVARAGSDNLWDTSSVTSITIAAGGAVIISAGSSFWWVQKTE